MHIGLVRCYDAEGGAHIYHIDDMGRWALATLLHALASASLLQQSGQ